jgi:hypothetical protein
MGIGLGGIPNFESLEHESKAITKRQMKDCHMQRYLAREPLFMGQDVEVINNDDHASHDGVSNRIVHKTCDDKDVNPCTTTKEDGQLGTIALANHNLTNQQTNNYPKLLEDTQFQLNMALS